MDANPSQNNRVLSGMRPTGKLHLGHLRGVLYNWLELQHTHECFFFVADWHALTTEYESVQVISDSVRGMIIDWLAAGLEPDASTLFIQSHVPEHAELHLLLSMITPLGWLERVPSYKDQQEALKGKNLATYGFFGYPLLQSADILMYKATNVPVGEDQVAHVELTREVARRFNFLYGGKDESVLLEPQPLLTKAPKMPGLDGQKMSKSRNNTISLREDSAVIEKKIRTMPTDPARVKRTDAGDPAKCPVWQLHEVYSDEDIRSWVQQGCRSAAIGCVECKQPVIDAIEKELFPIRERADEYVRDEGVVQGIIEKGCEHARDVACDTLDDVKRAIGLSYWQS